MSFCKEKCKDCSFTERCGGCSFCEKVFCDNRCGSCIHICRYRQGVDNLVKFTRVNNMGGQATSIKNIDWPVCIPVIPDAFKEPMESGSMIGLYAKSILSSNGENISLNYRTRGVKGVLNLKKDILAVASFYCKDRLLEGFWDNRNVIYSQLANLNLSGIIAPNFSVYDDTPRIEHIYNIDRSLRVYNEMTDCGLPAIPDISWHNIHDLDFWIRMLKGTCISTITFNFQNVNTKLKASNSYIYFLPGFKYFTKNISPKIKIIISGLSSPSRVRLLKRECSNQIIVLNRSAYIHSRRGMLSDGRKYNPNMGKDEIFKANIAYYKAEYGKGDARCQNAEIQHYQADRVRIQD